MPTPMPGNKARPFPTVTAAARAALAEALTMSVEGNAEFAGGIYLCGDHLKFTPPQTNGKQDKFRVTLRFPVGCSLAGIYHTHARGEHAVRFSANDVDTARKLGVPSFIVTRDAQMRAFYPGMRAEGRRRVRGSVVEISAGTSEGVPL